MEKALEKHKLIGAAQNAAAHAQTEREKVNR
jgi:hypothetical protein